MQELAAAETSSEPPDVENSHLTCEAVLPIEASIQTEVMEVDDLSGCPAHNTVNAASDNKIIKTNQNLYKTFFVIKDTCIIFQPPKATPCSSCASLRQWKKKLQRQHGIETC